MEALQQRCNLIESSQKQTNKKTHSELKYEYTSFHTKALNTLSLTNSMQLKETDKVKHSNSRSPAH